MQHTKESIVNLLMTNDKVVARALVVLNNRQTASERRHGVVIDKNNAGFKPCHALRGTSMAEFYLKRGYLTPKQIAWWREATDSGKPRITVYWRQLLEEANIKLKQRQAAG